MTEPKRPILDDLLLPDKVVLANMTHHPGWKVAIRLLEAAVERANKDVIITDPEQPNYDKLLAARQQRSRSWNELARWFLDSVKWHEETARNAMAERENEIPAGS